MRHSTRGQAQHAEEVTLSLRLEAGGVVAAELTGRYLVEFEDALPSAARAWRALELVWPYVRQQANTAMASGALAAPLPIELLLARPVLSGLPAAEQELPSRMPVTVEQPTAAGRVLPLPSRLEAFLGEFQLLGHIHRTQVGKIEQARQNTGIDVIERLAKTFGVQPGELLNFDSPPSPSGAVADDS